MKLSNWLPLLTGFAQAASLPPRQGNPIQIISVTTSGSGCPAGTVATEISPDGSTLVLGFDAYQTSVFAGSPSADREKFCDVSVKARYPLGCTKAVFDTTSHGFALLESGVSGTVLSSYSFSPGSIVSGASSPATVLQGSQFEEGDVYTKQDEVATKATVRNANERDITYVVRSRVFLQASNQQAFGTLTVDDLSISVTAQTAC